jgi:dihydroorotase
MKYLLKNGLINATKQNLLIDGQKIAYVGKDIPPFEEMINIEGKIVLPGLIDPHVHVRDLGQSEKEDWSSASKAALRGGITTIFDMPNNIPPTTHLKNLNLKREKAKQSLVNYRFNIALTNYNFNEVEEILNTNPDDIAALKLFLAGSSNNEYVFNTGVIKRFFELSRHYSIPIICHSELQTCIDHHTRKYPSPNIFDHNAIRHRDCAIEGTSMLIEIAKETGGILYIAHTSTAEEIDIIRKNKNEYNIYCEVTPHHLLLNENILRSAGNFAKVNPPIRSAYDNQALWEGINDGTVDVIATDHAPHRKAEKLIEYKTAPSGFPGLETLAPLMLHEIYQGKLNIDTFIRLTSGNASNIFNLHKRGKIEAGYYADITIVDMNKNWKIEAGDFLSKAKYSPFEAMTGKGDVIMTFVNGKKYKN